MNYLEEWAQGFLHGPSKTLRESVRVKGERKAHLGPRMDYARIEFLVEPAEAFSVLLQLPGVELNEERQRFIQWAVFGFLDVVMMSEPYPTRNIKISVVDAEFHPVESTLMAFRLAGRAAGGKLLEATRPQP